MAEKADVLREVVARIGLEFDDKEVKEAAHEIENLKGAFLAVGAVITAVKGALVAATLETVEQAVQASVAADRLGITTQAYQELGYAAQMADVSQDALAHGMLFLSRSADEAARGSKEQADAFARIGVSATDAHGRAKPAGDLLVEIANKFEGLHNPAQKAAIAMTLFGRGGAELIPLLNKGGEKIAEFRQEAEALGIVMSDDLIRQSKEFDESLKTLKGAATGIRNAIAEQMLPNMVKTIDAVRKWVLANRELIKSTVVEFAMRFSRALSGIVTAGRDLVSWFWHAFDGAEGFRTGLLAVIGVIGLLAAVTMSPVFALALLAALILAITEDYEAFRKGQKSLIGAIIKDWDNFMAALEEEHPVFGWLVRKLEYLAKLMHFVFSGQLGEELANLREDQQNQVFSADAARNSKGGINDPTRGRVRGIIDSIVGAPPAMPDFSSVGQAPPSISIPYSPVANITVNAASGQSVGAVADAVDSKVRDFHEESNRSLKRSMIPAGATP